MPRRVFPLLTAAFCLSTIAAFAADPQEPAPTKEQRPRITSKVETEAVTALSDEEAKDISFAAGRILKHVIQARDALRQTNLEHATVHVKQGVKLVAIVESVLPRYSVKTEITSGELTYSDEDDVTPRYVTLFDELERRDIISPVLQVQKQSKGPRQKNQPGQPASKEAPGALAISRAEIAYSTATLDIVLTRHLLALARQNLAEGKVTEADEALLAIQSEAVLFEFEEIDLPLEEAADNLKLAEIEMREGRYAEAKAALQVAVDQLKNYEELVGENQGAEVQMLHQEIAKLAAELESGNVSQADQQKHASRISGWWRRATKWFKQKAK